MTAIKEYKKLYILETYWNKYYVLESDKVSILDDLIEKNKFVTISWARVNISNISTYYPVPSNDVYNFVIAMPEVTRAVALKHIKDREKECWNLIKLNRLHARIRASFKLSRDSQHWSPEASQEILSLLHKDYPNE